MAHFVLGFWVASTKFPKLAFLGKKAWPRPRSLSAMCPLWPRLQTLSDTCPPFVRLVGLVSALIPQPALCRPRVRLVPALSRLWPRLSNLVRHICGQCR